MSGCRARIVRTKARPKEPVPPVTRMDLSLNMLDAFCRLVLSAIARMRPAWARAAADTCDFTPSPPRPETLRARRHPGRCGMGDRVLAALQPRHRRRVCGPRPAYGTLRCRRIWGD